MTSRAIKLELPKLVLGEPFILEHTTNTTFERAGISPESGKPVVWCTEHGSHLAKEPAFVHSRFVVVRDNGIIPDGIPKYIGSWWEANITFHLYEML